MDFFKRPAVEPDDIDAGSWRKKATQALSNSWSALTQRKRSEAGISSTPVAPVVDAERERQRQKELRARLKQEADEARADRERRAQMAKALEERVRYYGAVFPNDIDGGFGNRDR